MPTTMDDLLARMPAESFDILACEFLAAHEPTQDAIAGLLKRVGQLCYGFGIEEGERRAAVRFTANFK